MERDEAGAGKEGTDGVLGENRANTVAGLTRNLMEG